MESQPCGIPPPPPPCGRGRQTRPQTRGGLRCQSIALAPSCTSSSIPVTRNPTKKRSIYWKYYVPFVDENGIAKSKCLICQKLYASASTNGTSGLRKHHDTCSKKDRELILGLNLESRTANNQIMNWKFDQLHGRRALAQMIILDELPFRYVKHEGFRFFMSRVCPMFITPGRKTVRDDCFRMFMDSKVRLKDYFRTECQGMVSLMLGLLCQISSSCVLLISSIKIGSCARRLYVSCKSPVMQEMIWEKRLHRA
ncbi:Zinc finger BED domain-containing protein RICESLEEPER 1 [Linum grandiflorum]